ncbi:MULTISPECIES: glycosyltransferase family 2 protein [Klebsiella]|uniref:Glycosyltransferase EpsE n=1 Tax=Klebsiella spallanzanii TaxID=2587528 RepID=A0A564K3R4_9ENTR|nr:MULTISPECIES: glycosyltransferase [Klebsiella]MBA7934711.1 glycosyltransferase [Klebsiella sp. RHBSTW-00215]VUS63779.1 Putative glycosyltransferase EpsE [Klebsiella spallanzanii]
MCKPLISVLMPVYNASLYLKEAIDSVLNQSESNFELILINDGSSDNSEEIILSYVDSRIRYIKNETNLGLIKSLNKGIELARGEFIARMDSDDISLPNRFKEQLEVFRTYIGIDIVNVKTLLIDDSGTKISDNRSTIQVGFEAIRLIQCFKNMISHPGVMVKTDLMKSYLYRDVESVEYIEDYDIWLRMLTDGHMCYTIEKVLLYYRLSTDGINRTKSKIQHERMFVICQQHLVFCGFSGISDAVLWNLLGENKSYSSSILYSTYNELTAYKKFILNKIPVSQQGQVDLEFWIRYRIFSICGRFIKKGNYIEKIGVLIFLLRKIKWFLMPQFIKKLSSSLSVKNSVN